MGRISQAKAASLVGKSRKTIYNKIKSEELEADLNGKVDEDEVLELFDIESEEEIQERAADATTGAIDALTRALEQQMRHNESQLQLIEKPMKALMEGMQGQYKLMSEREQLFTRQYLDATLREGEMNLRKAEAEAEHTVAEARSRQLQGLGAMAMQVLQGFMSKGAQTDSQALAFLQSLKPEQLISMRALVPEMLEGEEQKAQFSKLLVAAGHPGDPPTKEEIEAFEKKCAEEEGSASDE